MVAKKILRRSSEAHTYLLCASHIAALPTEQAGVRIVETPIESNELVREQVRYQALHAIWAKAGHIDHPDGWILEQKMLRKVRG